VARVPLGRGLIGSISMKIIHYDWSLFSSSGLILLAELAEEHWRDLAALPATGNQYVQHLVKAVEAFLLSRKCELLTIRTNRKERILNTMEKKPKFILQAGFSCYFVRQVLFVR
jgi:hypothetical protein